MKKVCIFGDSIGKGVYLPDEGRYKVAKPKLSDTEVKNYSLFGCTVDRALSIVERHADELSEYERYILSSEVTIAISIGRRYQTSLTLNTPAKLRREHSKRHTER